MDTEGKAIWNRTGWQIETFKGQASGSDSSEEEQQRVQCGRVRAKQKLTCQGGQMAVTSVRILGRILRILLRFPDRHKSGDLVVLKVSNRTSCHLDHCSCCARRKNGERTARNKKNQSKRWNTVTWAKSEVRDLNYCIVLPFSNFNVNAEFAVESSTGPLI